MALTWSESFAVGHPMLDAQHRRIFESINTICASVTSKPQHLKARVGALRRIAEEHFDCENFILLGIGAEAMSNRHAAAGLTAMSQAIIAEHVEEHKQSLELLDSIIEDSFLRIGLAAEAIGEALPHWFVNHAVKGDAHVRTLFQAMEKDCPALLRREWECFGARNAG